MRRLRAFAAAALLAWPAAASAAPPPIRIGLAAPLTGPDAGFGQGMQAGAEQAVAEINRGGGVNGQKLQLVVRDDAGDPKQAATVAKSFATAGVTLVIGHLNSGTSAAALGIYEDAGILAVTPGATWSSLTARGAWNLFRLCGSDAQQGALAGAWLAERFPGKRVALINDKTTFGRGLADEAARVLKEHGGREALFEGISRGDKDFSGLVARMKAAKIGAVYFGGLSAEAALLVRAMREAGYTGTFIGSDGILDKDFAQIAGAGAEGTVMTLPPEPRKVPDGRDRKPAPPRSPEAEVFASRAYAAVEVLKGAIEANKSADPRRIAEFLHAGRPLRTLLGDVSFDAKGDLTKPPYEVVVWRRTPDGRIDYAGTELPH
ncbi:branched-chain amino acid ABC transporter substrate-binding protein [Methylobacterium gnaphalii]|uniref:Branched chain amino acid ABC transporter substrate-binding protein n=1 Tax=Methylobacterium gnaphalii TaxID=1010610 RepID=A0A512JJ67_9HYPH|nr:branched-chain amino acid ABC transporter substrate-binding protein [Methylobacterium gnaphalii]GEP09996.1 branched chain amino acid ABC transporter substrate-binding protein [Methylobacterium gnaphalii]GJD68990.1 Leucine-, isoleucine-, valine-, threonine-, and alanine-binding protein [Methylobacterium gnaphalii]GLS48267.1 branched chain amino acid ABC transporter substrate-binding protein [Methylobacterium gnaphalii]